MSLSICLNEQFAGDWTQMAGTEGTWEYVTLAATRLGRIGYRDYTHSGSPLRIRVEPTEGNGPFAVLSRAAGWKQPGDAYQLRHSVVVPQGAAANTALALGLSAIKAGELETVINPAAPQWARDLIVQLTPATTVAGTVVVEGVDFVDHPTVGALLSAEAAAMISAIASQQTQLELVGSAEVLEDEAEAIEIAAEDLRQAANAAGQAGFPIDLSTKLGEMLMAVNVNAAAAEEKRQAAEQIDAEAWLAHERAKELERVARLLSAGIAAAEELGFVVPTGEVEEDENSSVVYTAEQLEALSRADLRAMLRERGESPSVLLGKQKLVARLLELQAA